jgi:hypothetical protein
MTAHAHIQRLISAVKIATMLEECTTEEQRSVVRFLLAKGLNALDIHKEMFPVYDGNCLSLKRFKTGLRNSLKEVRKSQLMPNHVRKWLSQQSKDFYAAGFDALVKRVDKYINIGGGYIEK